MVGLKRRRRVEGWALDVSETDSQVGRTTLWQRIADNNKIWVVCIVAVLLVTGYLVKTVSNSDTVKPADQPRWQPREFTEKHREFEREFALGKFHRFTPISAEFVTPDRFRIVVPANASKDDIESAAVMTGSKIQSKMAFQAVVEVHRRSASGAEVLVATASWIPEEHGYVVKHTPATGSGGQ